MERVAIELAKTSMVLQDTYGALRSKEAELEQARQDIEKLKNIVALMQLLTKAPMEVGNEYNPDSPQF